MTKLSRILQIVSFALLLSPVAVGCGAIVATLPAIIAAVTDGLMVVDAIKEFTDTYFKVQPNTVLQDKVIAALTRAKQALNTALHITQGTEKLTQEQVNAAFADFRQAYADLLVLVTPLGVTTGDSLRATPGGLYVPEPMALTLSSRK